MPRANPDVNYEISIHALLAESDPTIIRMGEAMNISIHALLAESDTPLARALSSAAYFYPRSPCGERRLSAGLVAIQKTFLSTLSLRRAT